MFVQWYVLQISMNVSLVETTAAKPASTQLALLSVGAWQGAPWTLTTQRAQVTAFCALAHTYCMHVLYILTVIMCNHMYILLLFLDPLFPV